jgi:hypothetical protein
VRRHADFETVELWFEHDLYDQLQLVQVLAFFASEARTDGLILLQADDFLGAQSSETILKFAARARPVASNDLDLGKSVWSELAEPTPVMIADRVARNAVSSLPFLVPALRRFLEELPSPQNGLSRTEQTILDLIAGGVSDPKKMFATAIRGEEAAFMGDWSFFRLVEDLADAEVPLIAGLKLTSGPDGDARRPIDATLALTTAGQAVREGREDHVSLSGLDRWWAGTRLIGRSVWRFDRNRQRLVAPGKTGA